MNELRTLLVALAAMFGVAIAASLFYKGYLRAQFGRIPAQAEAALREMGRWKESDGWPPSVYYVAGAVVLVGVGLVSLLDPTLWS